ncbi:MAG: hydrogenase maturation protease [Verrucomicrobiota bacterium]|nr:hydrogenase maturation protease [Verrucomicrobiota bacterium]
MSQRAETVVIGLGNLLMGDEGVGIRIIRKLAEQEEQSPDTEFVEAGAAGMGIVHALAGRKKAVIIDCARMGERPGAMLRFAPRDVASRKAQSAYSLHEGDILQAIELSARLGECPASVVIFGVEPVDLGPGDRLSPALNARLDSYVRRVARELAPRSARLTPPVCIVAGDGAVSECGH